MKNHAGHILLVNPWIYDFAAYNLWGEPLGLLSIGAVLRDAGYQVSLLDCLHPNYVTKTRRYHDGNFIKKVIPKPAILQHISRYYSRYGMPLENFDAYLTRISPPNAILVTSGMTYWYLGVQEAIRRIRALWRDVPILLGGTYATLCYDHARVTSGADYVIRGEGERAALKLVGELTGASITPPKLHFNTLPYAAHELRGHLHQIGYVGVETSRGCPFACTYCASHLLHPTFRQRAPQRVADEIEYYHRKYNVRDFAFFDDALLINPDKHIRVILNEILRRGLECRFHTPNGLHARSIDRDLARLMYRAGFKTVRLGLETIDRDEQRRTGGKVNTANFREAVINLRAVGFTGREVGAYILTGLPGQSIDAVKATIRFAHDLGIQAKLAFYSPLPGTQEWQKAVSECDFPADADPLLHNNTIFPLLSDEATRQKFAKIKLLAKELNSQL